jgi:hypothetical protein
MGDTYVLVHVAWHTGAELKVVADNYSLTLLDWLWRLWRPVATKLVIQTLPWPVEENSGSGTCSRNR